MSALLLVSPLLALSARAQEAPSVVITQDRARTFRVAVQRFIDSDVRRAEEMRAAIGEALEFSGVLAPLAEDAYLGPLVTQRLHSSSRDDCIDWTQSGADAVLEGAIQPGEIGMAKVEFAIWDSARCKRLASGSYEAPRASFARLALRIADDAVEAFTGLRGAAETELAFISTRTGHRELMVMDALGGAPRAATNSTAIKAFPDWLPDGRGVLYTAYATDVQPGLYMSARAAGVRAGGIFKSVFPGRPKFRGVFDPSGDTLAFVTSVDGAAEIFSVQRDGRRLRRLTYGKSIEVAPSWSPDGKQIAFVSDRAGLPQIYVMDRDGRNKRRLTFQGSYNAAPAWSPDGRWIAYQTRVGGQFDIWLIDPSGEVSFPLTEHPRGDEWPTWSPDGRKIAFSSTRRGRADLYVMDVSGDNLRRLTRNMGDNTHPNWGPFAHGRR